jgi:hypothetical protein
MIVVEIGHAHVITFLLLSTVSFVAVIVIFSRSGVEINFSDVNIVTEVEHFLIFLTVVTKI